VRRTFFVHGLGALLPGGILTTFHKPSIGAAFRGWHSFCCNNCVDTFIPLQLLKKGNTMLKNKLLVAALASAFSLPALADTAPASPFSTNVALTTNYLYRGISQSGAKPAIQGGFDYANANGLYAGVWGSSISWISDEALGNAANAGLELDTYAGYKGTVAAVSYDVGFLRYNYPGTYHTFVAGSANPDTNEVYGAVTYSIVTAKLSYSLGDTFGVSDAKGSTYIDLSANYPIGDSGFTLGAHWGKQTYKGSSADTLKAGGADPTYSDYKLSVTKDLGTGYSASLTYSKTNAATGAGAFYYIQNRDLGKGTAVVALSRTF
jgi:uncharacterized protein (TIGR02001 family)